jgi:hypothetical protein
LTSSNLDEKHHKKKKNEGEQFSDNRNWARLHQRLIIRKKKKKGSRSCDIWYQKKFHF